MPAVLASSVGKVKPTTLSLTGQHATNRATDARQYCVTPQNLCGHEVAVVVKSMTCLCVLFPPPILELSFTVLGHDVSYYRKCKRQTA